MLVNNAGHDERHTFEEVTPEDWDDRFAVNLRHMMFVAGRRPWDATTGRGVPSSI